MNNKLTFTEYLNSILYLKDKVILPNGDRISRIAYTSPEGIFNTIEFQKRLVIEYNKLYSDTRRAKDINIEK